MLVSSNRDHRKIFVEFLKKWWSAVFGILGAGAIFKDFLELLYGNHSILTWLTFSLGILTIIVWLLYVRFMRVPSTIEIPNRPSQRRYVSLFSDSERKSAGIALIIIVVLSLFATSYFLYQRHLLGKKFIVAIASFEGPNPEEFAVTNTILDELDKSFGDDPVIKI